MALHFIAGIIASWASYYGNHPLVSVLVRFVHLAAIISGGGAALLMDFWILRTGNTGLTQKESILRMLRNVHVYIISWIVVVVVTGMVMTAADASTFLVSRTYWVKMTLVASTVINGDALLHAEGRIARLGIAAGWRRLANISLLSAILWFASLFAGTLLTVAA